MTITAKASDIRRAIAVLKRALHGISEPVSLWAAQGRLTLETSKAGIHVILNAPAKVAEPAAVYVDSVALEQALEHLAGDLSIAPDGNSLVLSDGSTTHCVQYPSWVLETNPEPDTQRYSWRHLADLPAGWLEKALRDVGHAVGNDPIRPELQGVEISIRDGRAWAVATDRYRICIRRTSVAAAVSAAVLIPRRGVDAVIALCRKSKKGPILYDYDGADTQELLWRVATEAGEAYGQQNGYRFPDWRALLEGDRSWLSRSEPLWKATFRAEVLFDALRKLRADAEGSLLPVDLRPQRDKGRLALSVPGGRRTFIPAQLWVSCPDVTRVQEGYLRQALCGRKTGNLTLTCRGALEPLSVEIEGVDGIEYIMPLRPHEP